MTCASGYNHSLFLDSLGYVWSCGSNQHGGLGLGHNSNKHLPDKINNLPPITSVSAGCYYSLFLDVNGCVWSCGYNYYGQLGLEDTKHRNVPEQIKNLPKIVSAIALGNRSIFLDTEGTIWSCGDNYYGELGLGDSRNRNKAKQIPDLPTIVAISGGWHHSLFLDCEGSVWSCGQNEQGTLGLGDTINRKKAEKIVDLPKIKSIAGGLHYSLFIDETGSVWVCGGNQYGQLGLGHTTATKSPQKINKLFDIVAVAGSNGYSSMFLDNKANVFTCGNNGTGLLGLGDKINRHTPQLVMNIPPIVSLSFSNTAEHFFHIVDLEGRMWGCGRNDCGQLGLGHTFQTSSFERLRIPSGKVAVAEMPALIFGEKEIFQFVANDTSKELMIAIKSARVKALDKESAKEKILTGVIAMPDWPSKWSAVRENIQQLDQFIEQNTLNLHTKQQKLHKLTQEINQIQQTLSTMEDQKQTLEFYDEFLQPIAEAEKELKSGFEQKLNAGKHGDFTVDEVSLFLNVCGMQSLVSHQRQRKIDGEMLEEAIGDVTVMEIKDRLAEKKMKFYLKVLESGKLLNEQALSQSMVWRHREVDKTLLLLKEWEIVLDEELVRKKGISICHLLFFKAKDFLKELGVEMKEAREMARKVQGIRKVFEDFINVGNE